MFPCRTIKNISPNSSLHPQATTLARSKGVRPYLSRQFTWRPGDGMNFVGFLGLDFWLTQMLHGAGIFTYIYHKKLAPLCKKLIPLQLTSTDLEQKSAKVRIPQRKLDE